MNTRALISLILSLLLCAACLSGCGGAPAATQTNAEPAASPEPTETPMDPDVLSTIDLIFGLNGSEMDAQKAMDLLLPLAGEGNAEAQYYIGYICDYGRGLEKDYEKAAEWYGKAADQGLPDAMVGLGFLYKNGQGVKMDKDKAQELFEKALELGFVEANYGIGANYDKMYLQMENKYSEVVECYEAAMEGDSPVFVPGAMVDLGGLYREGKGVEQDYAKAMELYQKAADLGCSGGVSCVGYMYEHGFGVEQDYAEAMEWFQKAADMGNSTAISNIGYMYFNGFNVEQDYTKAMECFQKAAAMGSGNGMDLVGYMYENGFGVEQDYAEAMEWYQKAADLDYAQAIANIGWTYYNANGVEFDPSTAMSWFLKAAQLDNTSGKQGLCMLAKWYSMPVFGDAAAQWYLDGCAAYGEKADEVAAGVGASIAEMVGYIRTSGQPTDSIEVLLEDLQEAADSGNEYAAQWLALIG